MVSSGTLIKDGVYTIPMAKGLPPGKYLVRISSAAPNPAAKKAGADDDVGGMGPPPGIERIAPEYNVRSQTIVEVAPGRAAHFDFHTKSVSP